MTINVIYIRLTFFIVGSRQSIEWVRGLGVMMFNATFNNISAIPWRSVLLVEVTEVPKENATVYWDSNLVKIRSPYSSIFSIGCLLVDTWD